jgi:hypothetical protein
MGAMHLDSQIFAVLDTCDYSKQIQNYLHQSPLGNTEYQNNEAAQEGIKKKLSICCLQAVAITLRRLNSGNLIKICQI